MDTSQLWGTTLIIRQSMSAVGRDLNREEVGIIALLALVDLLNNDGLHNIIMNIVDPPHDSSAPPNLGRLATSLVRALHDDRANLSDKDYAAIISMALSELMYPSGEASYGEDGESSADTPASGVAFIEESLLESSSRIAIIEGDVIEDQATEKEPPAIATVCVEAAAVTEIVEEDDGKTHEYLSSSFLSRCGTRS